MSGLSGFLKSVENDFKGAVGVSWAPPGVNCPTCRFRLTYDKDAWEWNCANCHCGNPFARDVCGNSNCKGRKPTSITPQGKCNHCSALFLLPDPRSRGAPPTLMTVPGAKIFYPLTCNAPTVTPAPTTTYVAVATPVPANVQVKCPSCSALCQVPAGARGQVFTCGACRRPFAAP